MIKSCERNMYLDQVQDVINIYRDGGSSKKLRGAHTCVLSIKYQYVQVTRSFEGRGFFYKPFKIWGCICIPSSAVPDLNTNEATIFFTILRLWLHFQLLTSEHSAVSRWESIFYHRTPFEVEFNILSTLVFTKTKPKLDNGTLK